MELKSTKNYLAQWFFSRKFREVLIFWCLKKIQTWFRVVWEICLSLLVSINTWSRGYQGGSVFTDKSICFCDQVCSGVYLRAQFMLYRVRVENTPFWHNPERREFFQFALLGHQNIKASLSRKKRSFYGQADRKGWPPTLRGAFDLGLLW